MVSKGRVPDACTERLLAEAKMGFLMDNSLKLRNIVNCFSMSYQKEPHLVISQSL